MTYDDFLCESKLDYKKLDSIKGLPRTVGGYLYDDYAIRKILNGPKPASKDDQEILIKYAIQHRSEWDFIEPWLDKETIEKYKTATTLNKLGF